MNLEELKRLALAAKPYTHDAHIVGHSNVAEYYSTANPTAILELIEKLKIATETLEFYADKEMYLQDCEVGDITEWELDCYGRKARAALAALTEKQDRR